MRKIRRAGGDARKSKPAQDRRSKPGFRPKGNNAGTSRPRKSADEEERKSDDRPRPRTGGRTRTDDSRPTRRTATRGEGSERGERSRSGPFRPGRAAGTGDRAERGERPRSGPFRTGRGAASGERSERAERPRSGPFRPGRSTSRSEGDERGEGGASRSRSAPYRSERGAPHSEGRGERPGRGSFRSDRGSRDDSRPRRTSSGGGYDRSQRGKFGEKSRAPRSSRKESGSGPVVTGQTRLNKYIANCGICSRREADDLIKAGVISVNGQVVTEMGYKVNPGDEVRYNNELLRGERPVYLLLNKPKDYITTVDDPGQRHTVMELIAGACSERVYPVGRLDRNTTGVLLFTNDGDLARKLMHPSFHVQKVYHVSLDGAFKPDEMERVLDGIHLEDGPIKADDIAYAGEGNDRKEVGIELHSGRNRIVRRIFEFFGHKVMRLDRTVFAGLTKKDLPRGRWRFLNEMEVNRLKMMVGEKRLRREGKKSQREEDYGQDSED